MSEIKVRRAGLVAFAVRLASTITGLAFVVIVTSNLSGNEFGLWQLIGRTVNYSFFPAAIITFWTTRYRARGTTLGKTALTGSLVFSAILVPIYGIVAVYVATTAQQATTSSPNIFYFLLSTPQVALFTIVYTLEAILWGFSPEKASIGFGIFEVSKVAAALLSVSVFHLSLAGAILAVVAAQGVQMISLFVFTRREFSDHLSFALLRNMFRNGWLAILNSLQPIVIGLDFLVVTIITRSLILIALFGAALVFSGVIYYASLIASGLYASILSGRDPRSLTNQVIELQLFFILPMVIIGVILSTQLMHLLGKIYVEGSTILVVLLMSSAFGSVQTTLDNVIAATDATDQSIQANFSAYLRSRLFLLAKINLSFAGAYLGVVGLISSRFTGLALSSFTLAGISGFDLLGVLWAIANLAMTAGGLIVKLSYVRKFVRLSIPRSTILALGVSSTALAIALYFLSSYIVPQGGELSQTASLLVLGIISLAVYGTVILTLSKTFREITRTIISTIIRI